MKIEGLLMDKGLRAMNLVHGAKDASDTLRVWVVLASDNVIQIWHKQVENYERIASIVSSRPEKNDTSDFVEKFSEWLITTWQQDIFDRVILIAPEKNLMMFHHYMSTDSLACVAAEISVDIMAMPESERSEALGRLVSL